MDSIPRLEAVDFRRNPYRGIFSEIAREEGVTRQAIIISVRNRNAAMLRRVKEKVLERRLMVEEFDRATK